MNISHETVNTILISASAFLFAFGKFFYTKLFAIYEARVKRRQQIEDNNTSEFTKNRRTVLKLEALNEQEIHWKEKDTERLLANNMAVLQRQQEANNLINEVIGTTSVTRFVIFHTHNGNGQPSFLKPFKVSYLQHNALPEHSIVRKYQNLTVDPTYTQMLIEIQTNKDKCVRFKTSDMEEGFLKRIYEREKVAYSEVHFLCATQTGIIYTSIATDKEVDYGFGDFGIDVGLAVAKLKSIFHNEQSRVFKDAFEREEIETRLKLIHQQKEVILSKYHDGQNNTNTNTNGSS